MFTLSAFAHAIFNSFSSLVNTNCKILAYSRSASSDLPKAYLILIKVPGIYSPKSLNCLPLLQASLLRILYNAMDCL